MNAHVRKTHPFSTLSKMPTMLTNRDNDIHVAIIGGGIAGVTLALGLLSRGVSTTVYEQGNSFREIGAGIGFTPNAERAMLALDPRIHAAFKRVTVQNGTDWFMWMDGGSEPRAGNVDGDVGLIHKMYLGERGFEGCARADFLDELVKLIPAETIRFKKRLAEIVDVEGSERVQLKFSDGSNVDTDVGMYSHGFHNTVT
jgi:salicylate hydroxylase